VHDARPSPGRWRDSRGRRAACFRAHRTVLVTLTALAVRIALLPPPSPPLALNVLMLMPLVLAFVPPVLALALMVLAESLAGSLMAHE
jgi:hypothetical protein